jgi:NADPH:quinone reductase-like Zn-dependent oxidoreductase
MLRGPRWLGCPLWADTHDEVLVRVRAAGLHVGGCSGLRRVPSACAEYARAKEDKPALKPAGLTSMEAAAVPTSAVTSCDSRALKDSSIG